MESEAPRLRFRIVRSRKGDIAHIVGIINGEATRSGAVLKVNRGKVVEWIDNGISLVAKASNGEIIAHMAAHKWPISGMVELRSSVVMPEFRGRGVSSKLTRSLMAEIRKKYGNPRMVVFINRAGNGMGILAALGFKEAEYRMLPKELFSIGPAYRGKREYGYRILVKEVRKAKPKL